MWSRVAGRVQALTAVAQTGAQQAFARGALTWSLPALTVCDPLAAVPVARYLLGGRLEPGHTGVWLPAGVVAAAGIMFLARSDETCRRPLGGGRRRSVDAPARDGVPASAR